MARSYVAIYQNKEPNYFVYYDFEEHEFFSIAERKHNIFLLTSVSGIIFYSLIKNVSLSIDINPFIMLLFSSFIGITLGFIGAILTGRSIDKNMDHRKKVMHVTNQELSQYLLEGKKQFFIQILLTLLMCFFGTICAIVILLMPQNVLMLICNIGSWAISVILVWAIRPIKRIQIHIRLKSELEKQM